MNTTMQWPEIQTVFEIGAYNFMDKSTIPSVSIHRIERGRHEIRNITRPLAICDGRYGIRSNETATWHHYLIYYLDKGYPPTEYK